MKNKLMKIILLSLAFFALSLSAGAQAKKKKSGVQTVRVEITEQGFTPSSFKLRRGVPARITFLRKTNATCATEVLISAYGINRTLPLNKAVVVNFTPKKSGEFNFVCGMNMMRGKIVVR